MRVQTFRSHLRLLRGDFAGESGGLLKRVTVRAVAVSLFRLSAAVGAIHPLLGLLVKQVNHVITGADIAWQAQIGVGFRLYHPTGVVIGPFVRVGERCYIQQGVTLGGLGGEVATADDSPAIGNDVAIGAGARVIGPVVIGDGAAVGANAVVTTNIPQGWVAVGVPAVARPPRGGADR